jgi:outer membrane protein assembly factor BamA
VTRLAAAAAVALLTIAGTAAGQSIAGPPETLVEIRIHGNRTTPDAEVLKALGLAIGQPIDQAAIDAAANRLRRSGRFVEVEIRKRSRSLEPGGDVSLVVVVQEHPLPDGAIPGAAVLKPFRRLWNSGMFMPILRYDDGYGFTYGARVSAVDWPGRGSRVSVPLSWGGTKRAALEYERTLSKGPFDQLFAMAGVSRQANPFYDLDEDRKDVQVKVSRRLADRLRATGHGGYADVTFGTTREYAVSYGADVAFDTRMDPVFPRNAVYASAGWERLDPEQSAAVNRFKADARGYLGLIRQAVLSVRVQYAGADGAQPDYARNLLGGADSLRGYAAGSFAGDSMVAASVEIRIPVTSPMGLSRAGVTVFADAGNAWNHGQKVTAGAFKTGAGVGGFFLASLFQLSLDVGFRQGGAATVHFTTGLHF